MLVWLIGVEAMTENKAAMKPDTKTQKRDIPVQIDDSIIDKILVRTGV